MKFLFDFLPILLFFIAYKSYDINVATGVLIFTSLAQVGWMWFRHQRIERMPLITALLVVLFGGATLIFQDEIFVKWKPTIANWLFSLVLFATQWISKTTLMERLLGANMVLPNVIWVRLNTAWGLFFFMLGSINLYVVYQFDTDTWVNFKLFGMLGLTLAFVLGQAFFIAQYLKPNAPSKE
jgi:intracellular septation protein